MKIIDRLKEYIEYKGLKRQQFEKVCGMSNGYFGKQLNRGADIGESIIKSVLENCPDINPNWLILGEGQMINKPAGENSLILNEPPPQYNTVNSYLEKKLNEKESELKEAYIEIGRLKTFVEQLKKDSNKADYATDPTKLKHND